MVKYDDIDVGRSDAGKKSSKGQKNVKKSKNLKGLKSSKGHQFGETFTEAPIPRQLDTSFFYSSDSILGFFAKPKSSPDTIFGAIIVMAKVIELLMLCHVFSPEEPVFIKPFCTEFLSAKRTFSLY